MRFYWNFLIHPVIDYTEAPETHLSNKPSQVYPFPFCDFKGFPSLVNIESELEGDFISYLV